MRKTLVPVAEIDDKTTTLNLMIKTNNNVN